MTNPTPIRDVETPLIWLGDSVSPGYRRRIQLALAEATERAASIWLSQALSLGDPLAATDVAEVWEAYAARILALFEPEGDTVRALARMGQGAVDLESVSWTRIEDFYADRAGRWAELQGSRLITNVQPQTRQSIRSLIDQAFRRHARRSDAIRDILELPNLGLSRDLQRTYDRFLDGLQGLPEKTRKRRAEREHKRLLRIRSKRIGATEAADAVNAGADLAYKEMVEREELAPDAYDWEWVARLVNVCPICVALDRERRPLVGGLYVSRVIESGRYAGQRLSFERPTAHPYCYCGQRTAKPRRRRDFLAAA